MSEEGHRVDDLARFATEARPEGLRDGVREALKLRVLDAVGCALGALGADPVERTGHYVREMGGEPHSTLIGGGRTSPDRAALYNGYLVRYLDFNDSYLAPGETCHPSDNVAPVLAAAEHARADGATLLTALAVAYQVQCRLSELAPVRARGFDHTVQGSYAVAAGVARALGLDAARAAHALAIAGTAFNALRVTRTGTLSHWKGLAYPNTAFCAVHATYLAKHGLTGPPEVFEGNKGFMQSIAGPFELAWHREGLDRVERTIVKRYNAEIHSQSVLEALQELPDEARLDPARIALVEVEVFDVAHDIIGGGAEGDKTRIETKEQADHSLPYMAAVMLLDGEVTPRQYTEARIARKDVQSLLHRVKIAPHDSYSARFPREMPCRVVVHMQDGTTYEAAKSDYKGFVTRPADWPDVEAKFRDLASHVPETLQDEIVDVVRQLERSSAPELAAVLGRTCGA